MASRYPCLSQSAEAEMFSARQKLLSDLDAARAREAEGKRAAALELRALQLEERRLQVA